VNIDSYSLADRGAILTGCPWLSSKSTLAGPLHYDDLQHYDFHWMLGTVTECNEEPDQLNVYDALYRQLGFDPAQIDVQFKRPTAWIQPEDDKNLDQFYYMVWMQKKVDLRRTGYYVVAPLAAASLRCMKYADWLPIIKELADRRPVVVVGLLHERMPTMGMSVGQFNAELGNVSEGVINVLGGTNLRFTLALIAKANAVVTLDTGPLYMAQALRVPAISVWGTHHPGTRIGYDKDYMDLAIWEHEACGFSPCYAYGCFPELKCPLGSSQETCQVLASVTVDAVTAKLDMVESRGVALGSFKSAT
jgi:ADP-heptose:LPS heptosyltransferase